MRRRVMWLFFWTTMAFWAGCSTAHKTAHVDQDTVDEYRSEVLHETNAAATVDDGDELDVGASLVGLDRSNWKSVSVGPISGKVPHRPKYFNTESCLLITDRPNALAGATIERQADAATSGARAQYDGRDLAQTPGLIGKTLWDIATVPVRAVIEPPTRIHESPSR